MVKKPSIDVLRDSVLLELFPRGLSKSEQTKANIIEATITSICSIGIHQTTYESVAVRADVTKQLVKRYFPDKDEMFDTSVKYIRAIFQKLAIDAMENKNSITAKFQSYLRSCFAWAKLYPEHVQVWLLFYHYAATFKKYRAMHTDWTVMGQKRIAHLIQLGIEEQVFNCPNPSDAARYVQSIITGGIVAWITEEPRGSYDTWTDQHVQACLGIVGFSEKKKISKGKR